MATLAVLRLGAIYTPCFSGFGAQAVVSRVQDSEAKVLITADGFLRRGNVVRMKETADAAAAASLATRGVFAPMLVTDRADQLPRPLEAFLLSVQPGYEQDPGEAVYNRVWILGDDKVLSVKAQARLDQITELIPVQINAP
jgi:acyl-coenzyme A synthetase/AMP-(fatty) acid ligase